MAPRRAALACAVALLAAAPVGAVSLEPGDVVLNGSSALHRVDPETGRVERISVEAFTFTDVAISASGEVYAILVNRLGFFLPSGIVRLDLGSGGLETIPTPGLNPRALAVEPEGSLLFAADELGFTPNPRGGLFRIDPRTGDLRLLGSGGIFDLASDALFFPWDVAVGPSGEIVASLVGGVFAVYPGDTRHYYGLDPRDRALHNPFRPRTFPGPRLVEVDPETGAQRTISDQLGGMLALTPDGGLFVLDTLQGRLLQVDLESGAESLLGSFLFSSTWALAADLDGTLLVVDSRRFPSFPQAPVLTRVLRIDPRTGETSDPAWDALPVGLVGLAVVPAGLRATIDVEPRRDRNRVALSGRTVRVALLGSDLFDVRGVDPASLAFGPAGAPLADAGRTPRPADLDGDGHPDLLLRFDPGETGLVSEDTEACLTGELGGRVFRACDAVEVSRASGSKPPGGRGGGHDSDRPKKTR